MKLVQLPGKPNFWFNPSHVSSVSQGKGESVLLEWAGGGHLLLSGVSLNEVVAVLNGGYPPPDSTLSWGGHGH